MALTVQRLNRATLARQLLLQRADISVIEGVQQIVALQAQEPASLYVGLWNRIARFDPVDLDRAFATQAVVRGSLMRITLHAVDAADYPLFHAAMHHNLRASRVFDRRYTSTGLTEDDADAAVQRLLDFTRQARSKDEIESMLTDLVDGDTAEPRLWWALRTFAPILRAPDGGPWSFSRSASYIAGPSYDQEPLSELEALKHLIRRYLEGFGPASAADFAQFALQRQSQIKPALAEMTNELERHEGPDGEMLYDVPDGVIPSDDEIAPPRLLAMWDSILLAYRDRSRVIPEDYRRLIIRNNGDVLPTLLVDGFVAGVWRPVDGGIEATAFHSLSRREWDDLAAEAAGLAHLLARDSNAYGRYNHWWSKLPEGDTRRLV